MPAKAKPEPAATGNEPFCLLSLLTDWTRQGTESFFASQRILMDLAMRQNANAMTAVKERLAAVRTAPVAALTEMVGEGISNLIAMDRVLLHLAQRENEILAGAMQERTGKSAPGRGGDEFHSPHCRYLCGDAVAFPNLGGQTGRRMGGFRQIGQAL